MKKILLLWVYCLLALSLWGQTAASSGFNFQAQARDNSGNIIANQLVTIQIAFSTKQGEGQVFYTENHQVSTDDLGLFSFVVGEGNTVAGDFAQIPWASNDDIWMDVALASSATAGFQTMNSTQLQAVPYAFYAETANQLVENNQANQQKTQSIRWTTSGNDLTVPGTHFVGTDDNQDLVLKTNNTPRFTFTKTGQINITSGVTGPDDMESSYPLVVNGSRQGIHIKVNGSRNGNNNFLTFGDDVKFRWGAVEGQTFPELEAYWQYQLKVASFALTGASLTAQAIALGIEAAGSYTAASAAAATLIFIFCTPGYTALAVSQTAAAINIGIQAAALIAEGITWGIKIREEIGVTYSSGAGDYAEWLVRNPKDRDITYGEIVGVSGGIVSLNTQDADFVKVVSFRPIVLGNTPQPEQEALYEKVAFLGQVPVWVAGKVSLGDYIIPSGNNDGIGIAVHPADLPISQFNRIVGVAWDTAQENQLTLIKIGIGINANDLAPKVEEISNKVDNIIGFLEGKEPLRSSASATAYAMDVNPSQAGGITTGKLFTDEEFDRMMDADAPGIRQFYADLEARLQADGQEIPNIPHIKEIFRDPVTTLKALRRDPSLNANWAQFDLWVKRRQ